MSQVLDRMFSKIFTPKPSQTPVALVAPTPNLTGAGEDGNASKASIHFESKCDLSTQNRCWTIVDFKETSSQPKLLKSHRLEFNDTIPKVKFVLQETKSGILFLKPIVSPADCKMHGKLFVKYGVSVGPHQEFKEDFSLESSILQVKKLNKSRLKILESKLLLRSYLVEGKLNLIIRLTTVTAKTSAAFDNIEALLGPGGDIVKNCSQFAIKPEVDPNEQEPKTDDHVPATRFNVSRPSEPFSGINGTGDSECQSMFGAEFQTKYYDPISNWKMDPQPETISILEHLDIGSPSAILSEHGSASKKNRSLVQPFDDIRVEANGFICNCNQCPKHHATRRIHKKKQMLPYKSSLVSKFKTAKDVHTFPSASVIAPGTQLPLPLHVSTPIISY